MAWRNQGITGSNNIPLGTKRRFGGDDNNPDGGYNPSDPSNGLADLKRGRSPTRELNPDGSKRRKKKNRWGDASDNKVAGLMGLTTKIEGAMTAEQLEVYVLNLRIEEITQKLRIGEIVPADGNRSPSPPPQYDNYGRRVNTREYRYRKRFEDERHKLIEKAMKMIPSYHPPPDYRRPTKTQEKVYVPVNDYPEINFIGLLIGPRGNTLKKMETESQAKIAIRGKGSVKEGKGRSDAAMNSNQEEDLHCLIMADTEEKVNKARKLINNIIETAASIPEGQNELKRNQLRELAALNGTLRDDENQACQNCGEIGHRKYDCPQKPNFTANIICRICGNAGHMAKDCPDRQRGSDWRNRDNGGFRPAGRIGMEDQEFNNFLSDVNGGAAPARIEAGSGSYDNGGDGYSGGETRNPWDRGSGRGAPAPWNQRGGDDRRSSGAPPPWANGGRNHNDNRGGYGQHSGYGGTGGAAPWHQAAPAAPPGGQSYGGYGYGSYGGQSGYGGAMAPAPPPGLGPLFQNYGDNGAPPPPPGDNPPPPPPPDMAPPPPGS